MDETRAVTAPRWVSDVRAVRAAGFTTLDWLTAVDCTDDPEHPGFDIVLRLLDSSGAGAGTVGGLRGIRLRTRVADGEAIDSITGLFAGAAWHERETFEMFGVEFRGFTDATGLGLRPLLLPDGFDGTPLRKSFQLGARASKVWPGGKEPGEGHAGAGSPSRRRVQAPGVPPPEWGPR